MPSDLDTFDFNALGKQAMAAVESGNMTGTTPDATAAGTPANVGAGVQPPSSQPASVVDPATSGQALSGAVETPIEVSFGNGRVEKLTPTQIAAKLAEAEANGLRQADYTRKTQEVARQRAETEQVVTQAIQSLQELQQYRQLMNNPQLLQQYIQQHQQAQFGQGPVQQQQQLPQFDPSQPMTMGQAQAMATAIGQQLQMIQQTAQQQQIRPEVFQQQMGQVAQEIVEDRLQVANYAESINATLNEIWNQHPILKVTPENEDILRYRVAQMQPANIHEATQAFKTVATEMATRIESEVNARRQQQEAQRAKLAATGTEPPGGVAPQAGKISFKDAQGRLDWNKLTAAARTLAGAQ